MLTTTHYFREVLMLDSETMTEGKEKEGEERRGDDDGSSSTRSPALDVSSRAG